MRTKFRIMAGVSVAAGVAALAAGPGLTQGGSGPVARYTIDAGTTSGMAAMGAGGGIGRATLAECERIARDEWRLPGMRMTVIDLREELIAWYGRLGYRRTGEYHPFPYGDTRFGIPKRDDLRFEVLEKPL